MYHDEWLNYKDFIIKNVTYYYSLPQYEAHITNYHPLNENNIEKNNIKLYIPVSI